MGIGSAIIEKYIWRTVVPYFFLAWFLLTAILLLQQASRYTDLLFGAQIPAGLVTELFLALLPNILAFTSPMALFAGVMIGLGQMQGESELIAMRAAGVSNYRILAPVLLLGFLLTVFTVYINLEGVPRSAQLVRQVGVKAALAKLESPLEPGVFNNEIPKYVIYAREGNREKGVWEKVFIHAREKNGDVRLITARSGKIDAEGEQSELVLQDAVVTTFGNGKQIALEKVGGLRVALEMGRRQLLDRLQKVERVPEEMGLNELAAVSLQKTGKEKRDAEALWHRRVSLAAAPLIFAFLSVSLSLHFSRGGRGFNAVLALLILVCYYLIALLCEQMSRAGTIPASLGSWAAPSSALIFALRRLSRRFRQRRLFTFNFSNLKRLVWRKSSNLPQTGSFERRRRGDWQFVFSGLLNRDLTIDLFRYFVFAVSGLLFLYLIFTSFELWRFAATAPGGFQILGKYLLYISPIVVFQVAPSALLLAVLFVYGIRSRKSEIVAWNAAGQNVFRLLIPAFFLGGVIGWGFWVLQENVLPQVNKRQDALRAQLRGGAAASVSQEGRFWFASPQKIYSFVTDKNNRSDRTAQLKEVEIYDFAESNVHLKGAVLSAAGQWENGNILLKDSREILWSGKAVETNSKTEPQNIALNEEAGELSLNGSKFFFASLEDLDERLRSTDSVSEKRRLEVARQKHFSIIFLPLITVLFSAPFAVKLGRRGENGKANLSLLYVLGIWLVFMATTAFFEQMANTGFLRANLAAWAPEAMLLSAGAYFLTKTPN